MYVILCNLAQIITWGIDKSKCTNFENSEQYFIKLKHSLAIFGTDTYCNIVVFFLQVCFLSGTLALGATKGVTKEKAMRDNLLNFEDLENLKLAEDLAKTCFEMYSVTSTGLAPEIAYFHTEVSVLDYLILFTLCNYIYPLRQLDICLD